MSNIDKQALRNLAVAAKLAPSWYAVGEFGDVVDPAKPEWKPVHEFCKTFTAARVLALLDELEAKEKRIAELEAREVVLPQRYSMLHRVDFDEPYHTEMVYKQHQVLEALHDAGVKVAAAAGKGD
ncbi:TPA: ead/Ea22-like family protein [Enterobacter hormaechei]|uniref:ead/Ea22-like family protein n=1 Tax=Enterobacter hormaechei TaxID=158836 RepID=UPI00202327D8|nr:ead/Ea22-like family protein [Enterobacter hormaechei]MCL8356007.1 ead/Ea22-like family protein [Enterobacter hormaechei subsp. xiangfangensis]MED5640038.1 ead/Ea22-like family protein [Enterobacter hormaechei]HAS1440452.1 ead/Ea22-like family protein [Enterobacter hormaechei]HAS1494270.1 ead/Ea22-like family protein [Enterobacter hormaechei]